MRRSSKTGVGRQTLGLVVEGQKREFLYFEQVRVEFNERERRASPIRVLTVRPALGGSAAMVLNHARSLTGEFDLTFCVLDGDRLDSSGEKALRKAKAAGVQVFFSFPCFEVWLLLHLQESCPPAEDCDPLKALLKRLWAEFERRPNRDWAKLRELTADAKLRARNLRRDRVDGRGTTHIDDLMTLLGF